MSKLYVLYNVCIEIECVCCEQGAFEGQMDTMLERFKIMDTTHIETVTFNQLRLSDICRVIRTLTPKHGDFSIRFKDILCEASGQECEAAQKSWNALNIADDQVQKNLLRVTWISMNAMEYLCDYPERGQYALAMHELVGRSENSEYCEDTLSMISSMNHPTQHLNLGGLRFSIRIGMCGRKRVESFNVRSTTKISWLRRAYAKWLEVDPTLLVITKWGRLHVERYSWDRLCTVCMNMYFSCSTNGCLFDVSMEYLGIV